MLSFQSYIFFYLNIEGWRVSADQQLQALDFDENAEVSGASVAIESPDFKKKAGAISSETKR